MTLTTVEGQGISGVAFEADDRHAGFLADLMTPGGMDVSLLNGTVQPEFIQVAEDVDDRTLQMFAATGHCAVIHA